MTVLLDTLEEGMKGSSAAGEVRGNYYTTGENYNIIYYTDCENYYTMLLVMVRYFSRASRWGATRKQ